MINILFVSILWILVGCVDSNTKGIVVPNASKEIQDPLMPECELLQQYPISMVLIQKEPNMLSNVRIDSCFFALVDTLVSDYSSTGDTQYIRCLDAICSVSDGFIGEYMSEAAARIYMVRPTEMVRYMQSHEEYRGKGIEESLIIGLRIEMHYSSSEEPRKKIDSITAASLDSDLLSAQEKKYLRWLDQQWQKKDDE